MKFNNLDQLNVKADVTADFAFEGIDHTPILQVLSTTDANEAYLNALLGQVNKKTIKRQQANKPLTTKDVAKAREKDRELFAYHVVKGWKNVVNQDTGEQVPFSPDNAKLFLQQLPTRFFDELRDFVADPENFLEVDVEEVAKN